MVDIAQMDSQGRLKSWKEFRQTLVGFPLNNQLDAVAKYWGQVPFVNFYLDFDKAVDKWPTPWELIHEGEFCRSGIGYLMYKTLEFILDEEGKKVDLKLMLIKDLKNSDLYMAVLVQDRYLLNYNHCEVVDWENVKGDCEINCIYQTYCLS